MKYIIILIAVTCLAVSFFSGAIMFLSMAMGFGVQFSFWVPSILLLILLTAVSFVIFKLENKKVFKILLSAAIAVSSFGLNFFITPFYPEDFENRIQSVQYTDAEYSELNAISTKKIKCIFLATCPFCEIAAEKLNILHNSGSIKDIEFIYFAHPKTADSIVNSQNLSVPYTTFKDKEIFKLVNGSFPAIILTHGDSSKLWTGNDVNFACMDYLKGLK